MRARSLYGLSILKKASTVLFGVAGTVALNRALGPGLRGDYAFIHNIIVTVAVLLHLGVSAVFPYYYRRFGTRVTSTFMVMVGVQFVLYCSVGVGMAVAFGASEWALWVLVVAGTILSTQLGNLCIVTNYLVSVVAAVIGAFGNALLLGLMLFFRPGDVVAAFLCLLIKDLLISTVCLFALIRTFELSEVDWPLMGGILRSGVVPMVTSLLVVFNYRVDVVMLGWLGVGSVAIGLYAVGLALAEYAWLIPDMFKEVVLNRTAQSDDPEGMAFACRASSSATIIFWLMAFVFAGPLLELLYGEPYRAAANVTLVVFAGVWSMVYTKLLGVLWLAKGEWRFYFLTLLGSATANVLLNLLLIPSFGMYGAAVASTLSYTLAGGAFLIAFAARYKFPVRRLVFSTPEDIVRVWRVIRRHN